MAKFSKLEADAFAKPQGRPRNAYLAEYVGWMNTLGVGQGGELSLEGDEKKATIKNRLNRASKESGKKIAYRRTSADKVRFQIVG
jgi:hypothetical protein